MMDLHDLELMIQSQVPILVIESVEEGRVLDLFPRIETRLGRPVFRWTLTEGLRSVSETSSRLGRQKPVEALTYIKSHAYNSIYVLVDFHHHLDDPVAVRLLKDIATNYHNARVTIVLLSSRLKLPEELRRFSRRFELTLPDQETIRKIVYQVAGEWGAEHGDRTVETNNKTLDLLVRNLSGLTVSDVRRLARNVIYDDGAITPCDLPEVLKAKYELLGQEGVLGFEYETAQFSELAGLSTLKSWLEKRKWVFQKPDEGRRLDPPKGILLLGVQGCGKSMAAKACAGIFGVPLLRLDFGTLYNKYHGETERNLREALSCAEVMAPCVLWMDEIEKGVAGQDQDQGTSRRLLGHLLTWMAEKKPSVFLVATANDVQSLPPELMRKGRFDEIFFVDLPGAEGRREIFKIHLQRRGLHWVSFDLDRLSEATDGFSGAEIEQAIVAAMYTAYSEGEELSTDGLIAEIEQTRPLSVTMAEKVAALREWALERTVPAD